MSTFTFENNGTNTYLVYEITPADTIDTMSLGMITNNKINGLAQSLYTQLDNKKYIKYNVSSKIDLQSFLSGPINRKRLLSVFKGITDAFLSAEEYMLDNGSIILDIEYIFADVSTCEISMICLPVESKPRSNIDIGEFFRNMIYAVQSDETEDCSHVAKIINYLNKSSNFSLVDFKKELIDLENGTTAAAAPVAQAAVAPQPVAAPAAAPVAAPVSAPVAQAVTPAPQAAPQVQKPAPAAPVAQAVTPAPQPKPAMNIPMAPAKPQAPMKTPNGMTIPPKPQGKAASAAPAPAATTPDGKEISLFYLLQHYNSENAAAYKAQKEAKKAAAATAVQGEDEISLYYLLQHYNSENAAKYKQQKEAKKAAKAQAVATQKPAAPATPPQMPQMPQMAVPHAPQMAVPHAPVQPPVQAGVPAAQSISVQPVPPVAPAPQPMPPMPPLPTGANFGETTVLGGGAAGETTVLNAAGTATPTAKPMLIRSKNRDVVQITKFPFKIGKERSYVDYFIGDNTAISRSHAEILSHDNNYYVKDTNSTNHTYVNGTMIQSSVEVKIEPGDRLRFANEEYEFRLS